MICKCMISPPKKAVFAPNVFFIGDREEDGNMRKRYYNYPAWGGGEIKIFPAMTVIVIALIVIADLFCVQNIRADDSGWGDPLDETAVLQITDFPAETEFYAAGIADDTLKKLGISGMNDEPGKLADAAVKLSSSMTDRQKELIHSDGMMIRGLAFERTYLITGNTVETDRGLVTPLPFLVRPQRGTGVIRAEVKYTLEKNPGTETENPGEKTESVKTESDTQIYKRTGGDKSRGGTAITLKKKDGKISLEPVRTGDTDLKEIGITILSAFILGLAVIIRKKIR